MHASQVYYCSHVTDGVSMMLKVKQCCSVVTPANVSTVTAVVTCSGGAVQSLEGKDHDQMPLTIITARTVETLSRCDSVQFF